MKNKNYVFVALLILFPITHAHSISNGIEDRVKFGVHLKGITLSTWGVFGEYKVHEAIGLQAAILKFSDFYFMKGIDNSPESDAFVRPHYVAMPLLFRLYPGEKRQFGLYVGVQLNRLIGGKILLDPSDDIDEVRKEVKELGSRLKDEDDIRKWTTHSVWGFDFEWPGGIQWGIAMSKGLSTLKQCDEAKINFTCKMYLGYNLAKLLD